MTHREKIKHYIKDLRSRGVGKYTIAPPLYRLLWRLGWQVRPPLFQSFIVLFLLTGTFFGIFYGLFTWLIAWGSIHLNALFLSHVLMVSVLSGFGMATYYRWKARSLELTEWAQYPDA